MKCWSAWVSLACAMAWLASFRAACASAWRSARAFLHDPEVLLLDEPFTALDDRAIAVLQSMIQSMRDRGRTIIMSTHQLREALELASHVALLQRGQIVHTGERIQQMLEDTGWLYRTYGDN